MVEVESGHVTPVLASDWCREPRDTETGHFTQLVWSSSRQLGVGVTRYRVTSVQ